MRRGTTPTVTLTVTNTDGSPCDLTEQEVHVTFKTSTHCAKKVELTKSGEDLDVSVDGDATVIGVTLTQEETLSFGTGHRVRVQVRCKDRWGKAQSTDIGEFTADEILLEGEI